MSYKDKEESYTTMVVFGVIYGVLAIVFAIAFYLGKNCG
jgi:hypothetical protein